MLEHTYAALAHLLQRETFDSFLRTNRTERPLSVTLDFWWSPLSVLVE
jgi:hypothetical protein